MVSLYINSPVIRAASEKLAALKDVQPKKDAKMSNRTPSQSSQLSSGLPSASEEVLEAQKKRFEELKVATDYNINVCTLYKSISK